jgi:diacylglycerol kinase family enzyme
MTKIDGYADFFRSIDSTDDVIICGGDGTLNRFINDAQGVTFENKIYYYAIGSGNDFARELGKERAAKPNFPINKYLTDLPTVRVKLQGMDAAVERVFLNGIGYGIDGYCCEMGDIQREKNEKEGTDKPIDYTAIAIKGLLFDYKPTGAKVTVDGKEYTYKKVWIAPTMNGKYYGGGMIPTPDQERLGKDGEKKLSLMVFHDSSKLGTLMIFPSIFKGEHVKHEKYVTVLEGKEIKVEFTEPRPLQIDGETLLGVKSYTAKVASAAEAKAEAKAACEKA